uniref:Venom redulysin 8 n=1 Tax=Platymeris rhadamanthus TaxID=1134088 RepID=A0A6B9L6E9_PLARH|nr:venom redulysin 8 [Platymeris rhadamanthus]
MSKFWLLLLFLAVAHYAQSFPSEYELDDIDDDDYMNDDVQIYDYLSDDNNDEERGIKLGKFTKGLKKFGKAVVQKGKKFIKKVKGPMKNIMKKGAALLKNLGVKINPLQCEEKTCKTCIIMKIPTEKSFCLQMTIMRTNKASYLKIALTKDDVSKFEQNIKLGDVPRCLNLGGFIGKICLKGIEGRAKSSQGQGNVNFCLGIVAEKFGFGCKFCATYENKKLKVKFEPTTFPGGIDESGDIVQLDKNGEDAVELGADEFEVV